MDRWERGNQRSNKPTSPPTVWYSLTPVGQELCGALTNVVSIAQRLKWPQVTKSVAAF
jgi:DNA-binding HxlR family transcriptional regulator